MSCMGGCLQPRPLGSFSTCRGLRGANFAYQYSLQLAYYVNNSINIRCPYIKRSMITSIKLDDWSLSRPRCEWRRYTCDCCTSSFAMQDITESQLLLTAIVVCCGKARREEHCIRC